MVLPDSVDDYLAEFVFPGYFHAIFDMGYQNKAGHGWRQFIMLVFAGFLIFNEIQRFFAFADIMIIPADFGQ